MGQKNDIRFALTSLGQRTVVYVLFLLGGLMGLYLFLHVGVPQGMLFYLLPFVLLFVILCVTFPLLCFFFLYAVVFVIAGLTRYIQLPVPMGGIVDLLILFNFLTLGLHYIFGNKLGKIYFNPFLFISILWMFICFLELLNPMTSFSNWMTTVRSIGIYIVLLQVLVFLDLDNLRKLRYFFTLWGILVILAALKAIGQKYIGFDAAESVWLYTSGAHTHLIYSGVRYFSFFTDAANFGCHMGLAVVVFFILALYETSTSRRIFYAMIVLLAGYGMMISGTRAAMAVPFVGFTFFIILLKEWRLIVSGIFILVLFFAFFNFTSIGNSNADIRRMRTAFSFAEDASFNVRLENQKKMRSFMNNHPFGLGLGSSKHTSEGDMMHGIATDSSFVFIWVETGIIGVIFYILLCLCILGFGTYYVLVSLKTSAVRGLVAAATSGLAGIMIAGYANEVLHQIPTGQTVYILMGIIMLSPVIDKKLSHGDRIL